MKHKNKLLISLSLVTCFAINAMSSETANLAAIEVTDTALEAQIKSVTSQKLENLQASDIKDILKSIPSVSVTGNARYSQKVFVRGLEDKSSNITIDGAKISGQLFHHTGDQTIDAEMLKIGSIELGANSALSGSGVINGSFVYETKDPSDYLEEGQTFGGKISAGYQTAFGRKSLDLAVFSKINDKLEFIGIGNLSDDNKIVIPHSADIKSKASELQSALVKVIFKPTDANTFKLSYNKYKDGGDRQYSGEKAGSTSISSDPYNEITRDTFTLNYNYSPDSDFINIDANAYSSSQTLFVEGGENRSYWLWPEYANDPDVTFENKTSGLDIRNTSLINDHKITLGASYDKAEQNLDASGLATYTSGVNIGQTVDFDVDGGITEDYAFYLEDEIEMNKLLLTLGARYDYQKLGGVYSGDNTQVSPKLKAQYQLSNALKLRAGYGSIFKGASLGESAMLVYGISSNTTDIKAQVGHNFELGFDYDLTSPLKADNAIFGFTAYKYNVDNYMHPTKNLSLTSQSDIVIWGVESVFRYQKGPLALSVSHTYTDGEVKDLASGATYDHYTSNIHTFKTDLDYKLNKDVFLNYNAEFVPGNKVRNSWQTEDVERAGFAVHNIASTFTFPSLKNTKFYFGIDNIFNKKYQRHTSFGAYWASPDSGSYETGTNLKVKLSYKF